MDYPIAHFYKYTMLVLIEMRKRGYKISNKSLRNLEYNFGIAICNCGGFLDDVKESVNILSVYDLFADWHNERYLKQCFYNLQEKADCDGMSSLEYVKLCEVCYMYK